MSDASSANFDKEDLDGELFGDVLGKCRDRSGIETANKLKLKQNASV